MRYLALAADYDGTLAWGGKVAETTIAELERLRASGRKVILVTGRELDDLLAIFPQINLCERVVAENGALLYRPATGERKVLGQAPSESFVEELRSRGVSPLSIGHSIVATTQPHEIQLLETIRDLGLELQVIFNKGAVMVLPAGVNKASGLKAALDELSLSPHNVVAIGDAENDHALLSLCEYSVAVANAVPMLREAADRITSGDHGAGVVELIQDLIEHDLTVDTQRLTRHHILLGSKHDAKEVHFSPSTNILVAGSSASGKSTLATGVLERLAEQGYQFCVIDPEGDYESFEKAIQLGNSQRAPTQAEILTVLEKPDTNAVINLLGLPLQDRPSFFTGLLPRLQELRAKTGRPHCILIDETHHLLPVGSDPAPLVLAQQLSGLILVTVHPDQVAPAILEQVDIVVTMGEAPAATLNGFCKAVDEPSPENIPTTVEMGEGLHWSRRLSEAPFTFKIAPSETDRRRHRRKYAEGELAVDQSFYFRGPDGRLNLRAQNLILFMQIADGVDDETWSHHLRQGDYSQWVREVIKDPGLAEEIVQIEKRGGLSADDSRRLVRVAIEEHYTLPAVGAREAG